MKRFFVCLLVLCFVLFLNACASSKSVDESTIENNKPQANPADELRNTLKAHTFHGVTFYLPEGFTQSNIFADSNKGRITFTDSLGINVLVNVTEASYVSQYYGQEVFDSQSYAQVYYDTYSDEISDDNALEVKLANQYDVPYIRLCGNVDGAEQFGVMGYYYSGSYCACISVYTDDQELWSQHESDMLNFATIATFSR